MKGLRNFLGGLRDRVGALVLNDKYREFAGALKDSIGGAVGALKSKVQDLSFEDRWRAVLILVSSIVVVGLVLAVAHSFFLIDDPVVALGTTHFTNLEAEDVTATDDLAVTDDGSIGGDLEVTGKLTTTGTSSLVGALTVTGATALNGGLTMDTTAFSVADTTGYTVISGTLTVSDTSALVGVVTTTSDVVVGADLRFDPQTAITVTNGAPFAPTGTYQPIAAATEVTPTVSIGTEGDLVVLVNTSAQIVNIVDAGTMMLSAAWAGNQYDTLTLICDGTNWLEISRSDN